MVKVALEQKEQCSIFETEAKCEIVWMREADESLDGAPSESKRADGKLNSLEFKLKQTSIRNNVFMRIKKFNDVRVP